MVPIIQGEGIPEVGDTYHVKWTSSNKTTPLFYFEDDDRPIPDHMFDGDQASVRFAYNPV